MKRRLMKILFLFIILQNIFSQNIPPLEFSNQKVTDILLVLADLGKCTIVSDETVKGNVSYYFAGGNLEESLSSFLDAFDYWYTKENDVYYVSKINISENTNELLSIDAEDVDLTFLIKTLSKKLNKTIVYDTLPKGDISIHAADVNLATVLEILIRKNWDYELIEEDDYFYIQKVVSSSNNANRFSRIRISENEGNFSIEASRIAFNELINQLFEKANKEQVILMKTGVVLENISYKNKSFDQLLKLILSLASADYILKDDVYYIFETQRNGIIKKLQNTTTLELKNISVEHAITLIPSGYDVGTVVKVDKTTNKLYLTGTAEEIEPIKKFIEEIDKPIAGKSYERFDVHYGKVTDILKLIPSNLLKESVTVLPDSNSFIAMVTPENSKEIKEYLKMLDKKNTGIPVRLKYIKNEDLLKYLPPAITKEDLLVSSDDTLVFFIGAEGKYESFLENLKLIDVPKPQVRYELLIIQYQKGNSINSTKSLSFNPAAESEGETLALVGKLSNLLNVSFDVVSKFGYQFAVNLSHEIGESRAKVLADTTLHGISGTDVKFQNTNTFRYNEGVMEDNSSVVIKTSTKEITSGLQLTINGWVSGDEMITMKVNAEVSKQGTVSNSSNNLPPTSEKIVTSEVRTKSGEPIIIGGLLQTELSEIIKKIPVLGSIPLLGNLFQDKNIIEETTEMAIYIVPHIYIQEGNDVVESRNIEKYYTSYVLNED